MNTVAQPLLSFRGMVKQLGGTLAVAGVDLDIYSGEIHALLGANGAGKSTLIKLLAGIHKPDKGEILFRGQPIHAHEVDKLPIAFIHQDLGLFDWMTVAENIAIGRGYTRRYGLIDWKRQRTEAIEALLFDVLERLRKRGVGMIYVTHRLDEVFRLADRATVMRDCWQTLSVSGKSASVFQPVAGGRLKIWQGQSSSWPHLPPITCTVTCWS